MTVKAFRLPARAGRITLGTALVLLITAVAALFAPAALRAHRANALMERLLAERFTSGRLSGQLAWHPCEARDTTLPLPRPSCAKPARLAVRREWERASERLTNRSSRERRTLAIHDLSDTAHAARAVLRLQRAVARDSTDSALHNDLAVAHLAAEERKPDQGGDAVLAALDAIERAKELAPLDLAISFNHALILQRCNLNDGAEEAWNFYLAIEKDPAWRAEAEAHLRRLRARTDTLSWDGFEPPVRIDSAARIAIRERVAASPQAARHFGIVLLGGWGAAVDSGDAPLARRRLTLAREIGATLEADKGIYLAVRAIDAARGDGARWRMLARGHVLLRDAFMHSELGRNDSTALKKVREASGLLRTARSPMVSWATFYEGVALILEDSVKGDSLMAQVEREAGSAQPALRGKAIWARGLYRLRQGWYHDAVDDYNRAAPDIIRSREQENRGALSVLLAEGLGLAGRVDADTAALHALHLLSPYRKSRYLANLLEIVAGRTRASDHRRAAIAVANEMMVVGSGPEARRYSNLARAYATRAEHQAALGLRSNALADIDTAQGWADSIFTTTTNGRRVRGQVMLAHGRLLSAHARGRSDREEALRLLDSAVAALTSPDRNDAYLPAAYYERAQAARALLDKADARRNLQFALEHLDRQGRGLNGTDRVAFNETVENIYDARIDLEMDEWRADEAFTVLESGRVTWPDSGRVERITIDRVRAALPDTVLLMDFALLENRTIIWTVTEGIAHFTTVSVGRDSVAALAAAIERDTTAGSGPGSPRAVLYEILMRPVQPALDRAKKLVIIPDRELSGVPFAALRNRAARSDLLDTHTIAMAPSARFYLRAHDTPRSTRPIQYALVVGNPWVDARFGGLETLRWAGMEADSVAPFYGRSMLLKDSVARRDTVLKLLGEADIFHFAGHGVQDERRPEQSFLALAQGGDDEGLLLAGEISGLSLSNLQVVVLSACRTLGQRASRTGPAAGLASSFLQAGAPVTISTLWNVDDRATTEVMVAFHHHLQNGDLDPAVALRRAQLQARRNGLAPRNWAAFVYTGP